MTVPQYVGIDLQRRCSVVVRMEAEGAFDMPSLSLAITVVGDDENPDRRVAFCPVRAPAIH